MFKKKFAQFLLNEADQQTPIVIILGATSVEFTENPQNVGPAFSDRYADMIVRSETPEEVSKIVKIANKY